MNVPDELSYTADHEWVRLDGTSATVGITDFAQEALGDVVFVALPELGARVVAGGPLGEVESTKSVSEIYAPIAGVVAEVNSAVLEAPQLLNDDPYGAGWLCVIAEVDSSEVVTLLAAQSYRELTSS